jgi:hypothetical protein
MNCIVLSEILFFHEKVTGMGNLHTEILIKSFQIRLFFICTKQLFHLSLVTCFRYKNSEIMRLSARIKFRAVQKSNGITKISLIRDSRPRWERIDTVLKIFPRDFRHFAQKCVRLFLSKSKLSRTALIRPNIRPFHPRFASTKLTKIAHLFSHASEKSRLALPASWFSFLRGNVSNLRISARLTPAGEQFRGRIHRAPHTYVAQAWHTPRDRRVGLV